MKVRTITAAEVSERYQHTKLRSQDFGEALDRAGVLLTPDRFHHIEANTIDEIAQLIATTSAHQWTGGHGNTQMDLMTAISDKLRALAADRRN